MLQDDGGGLFKTRNGGILDVDDLAHCKTGV